MDIYNIQRFDVLTSCRICRFFLSCNHQRSVPSLSTYNTGISISPYLLLEACCHSVQFLRCCSSRSSSCKPATSDGVGLRFFNFATQVPSHVVISLISGFSDLLNKTQILIQNGSIDKRCILQWPQCHESRTVLVISFPIEISEHHFLRAILIINNSTYQPQFGRVQD